MSILGNKLKTVSRAFKDVTVLLDRARLAEREALMKAVTDARRSVPEEAEEMRMGENPEAAVEEAMKAVREFEEELHDSVLTIRVFEMPSAQWQQILAKNPLPAKGERLPEDNANGFSVLGAAIDAVEATGRVVDGDTVDEPSAAEWREFWENINRGDLIRLGTAVVSLNEGDGSRAMYGRAKKA
ncbi:hypothetical protein GCM10011490_24250 [Pseudoclavibacter endophyticus]|uniref:Uncharacterized protein n=1 Tax=Pseudoclavibacter endophyticus TaxID=1778590 RepID=A0A6H9WP78_9MICO|nr:hypothetical protein [Pseudoclavibacter endophyticus]KAB1648426.1 hypothetical protein F8O04_12130 [Pseudoclavibacter endophyticus]GGA72625.1 hypothetical protein GCM10011490_24250 [Pseudoclavibacter endophyticus]